MDAKSHVIPPQTDLERMADALLSQLAPDPDRPTYTEAQMARRGRRCVAVDALDSVAGGCAPSSRDELRFLISVTRLRPVTRGCLLLWADGWEQTRIARALCISQQQVSQRLREGWMACYEATPVSFRNYCHHTIYRKPYHTRKAGIERRCAWCGEVYCLGLGYGRFCSQICRETACANR